MAVDLDEVMTAAASAIDVLEQHASVSAAFLFGSHADGSAGPDSDIDLGVFVEGAEDWDMWRRAEIASRVQREVGDDIDLHFFPAEELEHPRRASFAAYIIQHGIRLPRGT